MSSLHQDTRPRSRWFNGQLMPWEPGVYERQYGGAVRLCNWDGARWGYAAQTAEEAVKIGRCISDVRVPWRGLKYRPVMGDAQ